MSNLAMPALIIAALIAGVAGFLAAFRSPWERYYSRVFMFFQGVAIVLLLFMMLS